MKNKKSFIVVLVFAVLLLSAVCFKILFKGDKKVVKNQDNVLTIEKGKIASYNDITIKLVSVSDSRCPSGATCIWQGELSYAILINGEDYKISTVLNKTLSYNNYVLTIIEDECDLEKLTIKIEEEDKKQDNVLKIEKGKITTYNDITIELVSVSDSRCPKNVECFWEGELSYSLLINGKSYEISTVLNKELNYDNYVLTIVKDECTLDYLTIKIEKGDV